MIAIIALVISIAAAGFTGWQAINEHLLRVNPRPATFTLKEPVFAHAPWTVLNTGGSVATNIEVIFHYISPTAKVKYKTFKGDGTAHADKAVELIDTRTGFIPVGLWEPLGDGKWERSLNAGKSTKRLLDPRAEVKWRDYRGRPRSTWMRIP